MHNYHIYTSKVTGELLQAITEDTYSRRTQFHMVDYGKPQYIQLNGHRDYLTLLESSHILGASQVLLETHDHLKILYSGDISPRDVPSKCDILVIDSTHERSALDKNANMDSTKVSAGEGSAAAPALNKNTDRDMEHRLVEGVMENIAAKRKVCIHAHRGKLQHIMHILSEHDEMPPDIEFLANRTDIRVADVYKKYNYKIRDLVNIHAYEGKKIITEDYPYVEFNVSMAKMPQEERGKVTRITISGSYGKTTIQQEGKDGWSVSNEDAEFADVLRYVKSAEPRAVITEGVRTPHGRRLAEEITTKLGITAKYMPD